MPKYMKIQWEASLGSKEESFLENLEGGYSHPSNAKLTPMPKYMKIQKVSTTKTTQNALKYKAKTLYY